MEALSVRREIESQSLPTSVLQETKSARPYNRNVRYNRTSPKIHGGQHDDYLRLKRLAGSQPK